MKHIWLVISIQMSKLYCEILLDPIDEEIVLIFAGKNQTFNENSEVLDFSFVAHYFN